VWHSKQYGQSAATTSNTRHRVDCCYLAALAEERKQALFNSSLIYFTTKHKNIFLFFITTNTNANANINFS
jgi:hypothetical protein